MFTNGRILLLWSFFSPLITFSQETDTSERHHHRLSMMMASVHVPAANNVKNQSEFYIVPTWGINYDYWFTSRCAIGLHNDIELQEFEINVDEDVIERSYPVASCLVGLFKPSARWTLILGAGREFEQHKSFHVITAGTEYGIEIRNNWEVNFNFVYDHKIDAYDSWLFGIGFSKMFK